MADSTPSDYHLSYLRERWERDRSSRVFLQLAEEYRRRGLHAEALEVLQVGLSHHPGYLAAQVSLGRCWLEAGRPDAAAEVLTGVLSQDPTQAVASRLLIEVWLRLRDAERARAAIERCELLGVPPQEVQGYRERLAELLAQDGALAVPAAQPAAAESGPRESAAAAEPEVAGEPPPAPAVAAAAAQAGEEARPAAEAAGAIAAGSPAPAPAPGEVFRLPPLSAPPLELPARPAVRRLLRVAGGDPFQLPVPVPVAPAAGAVFALGLAAAAAPALPPPLPPEALRPPAVEAPAELPAAAEVAPALAPAVEAAEQAPPPPAVAPVEEEPLAPAAEALPPQDAPRPAVEPPAPAPAFAAPALEEPVIPAAAAEEGAVPWWRAAAAPAAAAPAPAAPPAVEAAPGMELQPSGALPAPELRPSDPGTATLGELYLRQGHLGEAQKIFHQVLERDPDNEVALRGLEAIARRRTAALTAPELLGGGEPQVKGLTSRKILLLQRYLQQLRAGAARQTESGKHVP